MLPRDLLARLCRAREMLRDVESEPAMSVAAVAKKAGVSRFHFIRLFKGVFGETPRQCRARARLERAKRLLVVERRPVTEVCMAVGCSSVGSFSAAFARRTGVAPSDFQRRHRPDAAAPGELPRTLAPDCLSLMGAGGSGTATQEKRARTGSARLRPTTTPEP
jgi:AraC-like DNA-binding protein